MGASDSWRQALAEGLVIPACPLALTSGREFDERHQRALVRYYMAAGAGGLAVGVHTTQFAIREPKIGLLRPVLELAAETCSPSAVRVAGICGTTAQAVAEAELALGFGYHAGLLSLAALARASDEDLVRHCRTVAETIPVIGFYLQPAVGGRALPYSFWRRFAEIPNVVAIKIAPFNRYQTIDVVRAVAEAGRDDIALYTGNDDNIVLDLLTPFRFVHDGQSVERRIVGGLLGHWAVWTKTAVELHAQCRRIVQSGGPIPADLLRASVEVTEANAAFFDAANGFAGCIAGLHQVLAGQGLLAGIWCLDPDEGLSAGQREEIERVRQAHPQWRDDAFVERHRDEWLR